MSDRLGSLHALRGEFGRAATAEKVARVAALSRTRWRDARSLAAWHDELLFLAAFPGSLALHRAATRALDQVSRRVRALPAAERAALADSGIAGTETVHTMSYGVARWLARRGERTAFDWRSEGEADRLDALLRLELTGAELDLYESGSVNTREWIDAAGGRLRGGPTEWLLAQAPTEAVSGSGRAWRAIYDAAEVPLRWSIGDSRHSTSRNRLSLGRPVVRTSFRRLPADPLALIATPLPGITRATGAEAVRWHDASVAALAARARDVFTTVYANPREIHLCPLGEGAMLCVLGANNEDRSALEANYGYVMFSNGIPIGYGGVTPFGAQANTGVNLFEPFRRSEAAFLFAQTLRAFRTLFGVTRLLVNPYQIGEDNQEAIDSGAYWFYDRLGFRPVRPRLAAIASRERAAIARDRAHRSSRRTLRELAGGDLVLALPGAAASALLPEQLLEKAGALATRALGAVPVGGRTEWIDGRARALLAKCTGEQRALTATERRGALHLVPVLAPLANEIARWPSRARRALWQLVVLKGGAQEVGFARAAARLDPLWRLLVRRPARRAAQGSRGHARRS